MLTSNNPHFVIITEEVRNGNQNMEKLRKKEGPISSLTKIRSICDYYGIETMDYMELFRAENWKF